MDPERIRQTFAWMETVVAIPPASAVEVECELVRRLYATRDWDQTRALLTDDFALIGPGGTRAGIEELRKTNALMADAYEDLQAEIETIVADPDQPLMLWVRDRSRGRAKDTGEDLDVRAWSRVKLAPDLAHVAEIGPSSVINSA